MPKQVIIYQIQVQLNLRLSHRQTITMDQLCSVMLLLSPRDISTKLTQIVASHNQVTLVIHHDLFSLSGAGPGLGLEESQES